VVPSSDQHGVCIPRPLQPLEAQPGHRFWVVEAQAPQQRPLRQQGSRDDQELVFLRGGMPLGGNDQATSAVGQASGQVSRDVSDGAGESAQLATKETVGSCTPPINGVSLGVVWRTFKSRHSREDRLINGPVIGAKRRHQRSEGKGGELLDRRESTKSDPVWLGSEDAIKGYSLWRLGVGPLPSARGAAVNRQAPKAIACSGPAGQRMGSRPVRTLRGGAEGSFPRQKAGITQGSGWWDPRSSACTAERAVQDRNTPEQHMAVEQVAEEFVPGCKLFASMGLQQGVGWLIGPGCATVL